MTKTPRTFKIDDPHMHGDDIASWQHDIKEQFRRMAIDCPIKVDGDYGITTRSYTASLCHALGMNASEVMAEGVTPELRIRIRNRDLTHEEQERMTMDRMTYRDRLRKKWRPSPRVHRPVAHILADSWGYHPGVHDGLDVICEPDAIIYSMVKSRVIDVRPSGWWGLGAPSNRALAAKGDGIIQVEVLETVGPFVSGHHIGYGHAEKARVEVGDVVNAGDVLGHAGLANAWHIHMMYNTGDTSKGIGNLDPRKILDYAVKHG